MGRRLGVGGMNTWFIDVEKHLRPKQIYLILQFHVTMDNVAVMEIFDALTHLDKQNGCG